jgi:hypothetical protein
MTGMYGSAGDKTEKRNYVKKKNMMLSTQLIRQRK